jgi:hypothetical protein
MISRDLFIQVIENLRKQYYQDKEYVDGLVSLFGEHPFSAYDNWKLYESVFLMLRTWFPVDEDGFCAVEHYCWFCEFGKVGDYKDAGVLYDGLIGGKNAG